MRGQVGVSISLPRAQGVKRGRFARHFEGWQLGALAVGVALPLALLVVPHRAEPRDLPSPRVDPRALAEASAADRARAQALGPELEREVREGGSALFDLRALGSAIRAYGRVDAAGDAEALFRERRKLAEAVSAARGLGAERLLALRAFQAGLFAAEVAAWERTHTETDELRALGGGFASVARRAGWIAEGGRLVLDDDVRRLLFERRWMEITGLRGAPYEPTPDETRAYWAFLLAHPVVLDADPAAYCREADAWRLRRLDDVARADPSFPLALARGVLLARLGRPLESIEALRAHLARSPDGPWALRARNLLAGQLAAAAP